MDHALLRRSSKALGILYRRNSQTFCNPYAARVPEHHVDENYYTLRLAQTYFMHDARPKFFVSHDAACAQPYDAEESL